ncbi:G-protein coupled receptor GRL101 [Mizuhopecten yessoensis]|uniref:G-protein coupled receptor GRL101 n=2 Tax=Mizuhopecten yessoensis TaxID=6573 RepID=A0A210Q5D2_MIZYE|nr:G-protein coupled receptor GRL101 [Mizuhopecten yessoensis]
MVFVLEVNNCTETIYCSNFGQESDRYVPLYLSNADLAVLPENVFRGLSELKQLDLSNNIITVLPENLFDELSKLDQLYLSDNKIAVLPDNVFNGLSELYFLALSNNKIAVLPDNVFNGTSGLFFLDLSNNKIAVLPDNVFNGLSKLYGLYLSNNKIAVLPDNVFNGTSVLAFLDLSNNKMIAVLPDNVFNGLSELYFLALSNNKLAVLPDNVFNGLSELALLDLSNNKIGVLPDSVFNGTSELRCLILSDNKIADLPSHLFSEITTLSLLDLANNALTYLPDAALANNRLSQLNIIGNKIEVSKDIFKGLDHLSRLYTDVPFICCVKPSSVADNHCYETDKPLFDCWLSGCSNTKGDAISSCSALVRSEVLRVCLWIIGISAFMGNLLVLFYRLFLDSDNMTRSYSFFVFNLALSDLLMGVYLIIIGVVDIYYNGVYAWNDHIWRKSILCTLAGVLSSVSSEMSTFLILLVTIDRVIVIVFPLSRLSSWNISWKKALIFSVLSWIVSITLAVIPIVTIQSYFQGEFYSQSSVCLALPLTREEWPGTEYSFAIFVCLNSSVFIIVVIGQICICKSMRKSGRRISSSQNRQREMTVAITLFFVVATDFFCWFPIGVMGVLAKCGVRIPDDVYAWVMVFVLPMNAAINPFLYTATAIWRKRRKVPTTMMIPKDPPADKHHR